jgi:NitT/TauT family transport system substrate-binding protein
MSYRRVFSLVALLAVLGCAAPQPAAPARSGSAPASADKPAATVSAPPGAVAPAAPAAPVSAPAARQPLSPRVRVTFAHLGQASDAGVYIALERGYFAEEGIDLETTLMDSGGRMVPSLAAGQLDVGGGAVSAALINAVSRDVPIKLIADKGSQRPGFGFKALSVRKALVDSGAVQSIADLRGRKLAVNTATSIDIYHLHAALQSGGLGLEDITLEEITYPEQGAALANGAIDAAVSIEPISTVMARQGIAVKLVTLDQTLPLSQDATIIYAPHFMRDQPEAGRRWMVAYLRGVRDYNRAFTTGEGRDEVIQILTKHTPIKDPVVFETMGLPGLNPNGYINAENIRAAQEYWRAQNLVQTVVPPEQFIDHSYLDAALALLGRVPD